MRIVRICIFRDTKCIHLVYIGFGSMVHKNRLRTAEIIRETVDSLGIRAIVAGEWAGVEPAQHDNIRFVDRIPHYKLFTNVAAAVHHGGAGTFWTCAQAGIPQAVLPHMFDQFYRCEKIARFGIGPKGFPVHRLTVNRLYNLLTQLLDIRVYHNQTAHIAEQLQSRNGLEEVVKLF